MPCKVRLFVDESGNAGPPNEDAPDSRYMTLVGTAIPLDHRHEAFLSTIERLKTTHFPRHAEEPVILHREDIFRRSGPFSVLQDAAKRGAFYADLLRLLEDTPYVVFGIVIDKKTHASRGYRKITDSYHYCTLALLERFCGRLRLRTNTGDVMAEQRGKREDMALKTEFRRIIEDHDGYLQRRDTECLTSKEIKIKPKSANVAGLQLADLIARVVQCDILHDRGLAPAPRGFAAEMLETFKPKYNAQQKNGRITGYGQVFLT